MKKIIAFLLSVIIAYTPTLIFAGIDDPNYDWNKHVDTGPWKHNKVTPYNTAGSTQPDYFNSSKYNVNSSRDVTSNGSKYKQTVNVAVEASKAEKAATIANRAKNYAEYLKKFGKASLPSMVGSAAIYGLFEGIDYVMDPENNTIQKPNPALLELPYNHPSVPTIFITSGHSTTRSSSPSGSCSLYNQNFINAGSEARYKFVSVPQVGNTYGKCVNTKKETIYSIVTGSANPAYDPSIESDPSHIIASPQDIEEAIKKALEENNAAQAAAIAEAIKDAFSESDLDTNPNTGAKDNPIADKTKKALDEKGAAELKEDADPTVCVPRPGDLEGQCTNMPKSEADQIPTLECVNNPIVSANSCVYQVDPNAPTKPGTIEKPGVNPETGELPEACVWFDVHCKWLEWTQEEPDQDNTDTEVEEKDRDFDFDIFKKDRFTVSRQCPAPVEHTIELSGISTSFSFDLKPLCDVLEMARPALVGCSYLYAAYIVIGAARNG
ncbi:virulence factor TspB C-terminal domain-related protein [Acinetobacter sp. YH01009]|uniref:virulence factor TspB C-terminal domain-related protein n=1 Tax=Acinetobacter sp. YH01009 TaxID=2601025 RepID=UPI0015D3F211|nr:virulence factor TspB C-terminal domain-related protein [Acinetobacter sp. YH01009]